MKLNKAAKLILVCVLCAGIVLVVVKIVEMLNQ